MKAKPVYLLYYGLIGAIISLISAAITKWGKTTLIKEGVIILLGLACVVLTHIIWYKHKSEVVNINSKKKLASLIALWTSVFIGVAICSLVLSFPDWK